MKTSFDPTKISLCHHCYCMTHTLKKGMLCGKCGGKKECQYPKCKKEATIFLGMADPDAEYYGYCEEHAERVKMNTMMAIFGERRLCKG